MFLFNLASSTVTSEASFFSDWLSGLNVGGIVLLLIGIALIVVEMIIPGFGVAGISGGVAVAAGLVVCSKSFGAAMFTLAIIVVILCIAALIVFRVIFGKGRGKSRLVLKDSINGGSTDISEIDPAELVGRSGVALSTLRPSGIAMIDGKRLDVLAVGEFVQKGESVVVSEVQGLRISVVKKSGSNA